MVDYLLIIVSKESIKPEIARRITTDQEKIYILNHYIFQAHRRALADFVRSWDIDGEWEQVVQYDGVELEKNDSPYMGWCLDRDRILSNISGEAAKAQALGIDVIGVVTDNPVQWLSDNGYTIVGSV